MNEISIYQILLQWEYLGAGYIGKHGEITFDPLLNTLARHDNFTPDGIPVKIFASNVYNLHQVATSGNYNHLNNLPAPFSETDPVFSAHAAAGITSTNISNWSTAHGWGNHATVGYLTEFTETDPVFSAHAAAGITSTNISNWSTAYNWGNHSAAGYLTSFSETDPVFNAHTVSNIINGTGFLRNNGAGVWSYDNNTYLTSFSETDPVFSAHAAAGITSTNISNWSTAYNWGNHSGMYDFYEQWSVLVNGTAAVNVGSDEAIDFRNGTGINITTDSIDKITITNTAPFVDAPSGSTRYERLDQGWSSSLWQNTGGYTYHAGAVLIGTSTGVAGWAAYISGNLKTTGNFDAAAYYIGGSLLYLSKLAASGLGTNGTFFKMVSGVPAWANIIESQWGNYQGTVGLYYSNYIGVGAIPSSSYGISTTSINVSGNVRASSFNIGATEIITSEGKVRSSDGLDVDISIAWDAPIPKTFYLNFKGGVLIGSSLSQTGTGPVTAVTRFNT